MSNETDWKVVIESRGNCGKVNYFEGTECIRFDWEFGARHILAFVRGPAQPYWDRQHPWAIDRRQEIMQRVAQEVIRQQASTCSAEFDYDNTLITVLSPGK